MTAQLDGIESAQPTAPVPSAIVAQWFPAFVALPSGVTQANTRVFITDVGLMIFDRRPDGDDPVSQALFWSPMDWPATQQAYPSQPQPRISFRVETEAGSVGITPQTGCGCHLRNLKNWVPSWTARSIPWGTDAS